KVGSNPINVNDGNGSTTLSVAYTVNDTNFPNKQYNSAVEDTSVVSFTNGGANNTLHNGFRCAPTINSPVNGNVCFQDEVLITANNTTSYGVFEAVSYSGAGVTGGTYVGFNPQPPAFTGGAAINSYKPFYIPNIACPSGVGGGSGCWGYLEDASYHNLFTGCLAVNGAVDCSAQGVGLYLTGKLGMSATTFASLGSASDGTIVYCSDCTATNPTAGSGAGALVVRVGGAWN